jgi:diphthamide synthase (EF-2-diphthine--ammonia ligase)
VIERPSIVNSSVRKKILLSWSSGKDSAWSLLLLRQDNSVEVAGLLTTINTQFQRVAMHGTRRALLETQAEVAGLPLWEIPLPWPCSNEQYEHAMSVACAAAIENGITGIAFGDLFLEDIRRYREDRLRGTGLEPIFPVWGLDTKELASQMFVVFLQMSTPVVRTENFTPSPTPGQCSQGQLRSSRVNA